MTISKSKQEILADMVKVHNKTVNDSEQVLVRYALDNDLDLWLSDHNDNSRQLITQRVWDEWTSSTTACGEEHPGIGWNEKKIGEWLYSSETC